MSFDIGSVVAHIKADTTGFKQGMQDAQSEVSGMRKGMTSLTGVFTKFAAVAAAYIGTQQIVGFLKSSSEEANNFARSMTTLEIISGRFNVSAEKAQQAAKDLGKELRIGPGAAAESLQNLLKSGLNLEQSTDLLKRFTNEAITGKSPSITLAQAVQNLSFAYATGNSALGNLSGVSENFVDITERGRNALLAEGVAANTITDDMAKYRGMVDLTNLTMGSAEKFTGTLIDKQAILDQKMLDLKVKVGDLLNPALAFMVDKLALLVDWVNATIIPIVSSITTFDGMTNALATVGIQTKWFSDILAEFLNFINNTLMPVINMFIEWFVERWDHLSKMFAGTWEMIKGIIQLAWGIVYGIIKIGLELLAGDWKGAWEALKQMTNTSWEGITKIFNGAIEFIKGFGGLVLHNLVKPFEDAWNKIKELVEKIKDNLDFTKRHSPSVIDIINKGVKLANRAMEDLNWNTNITPNLAAAGITGGNTTSSVNQISISLAGAYIGSEFAAQSIGEKIGDSIIRKLQQNVKF